MDRQLIVAGFHRSGTSFVTDLLHRAGLFIGDDLLDASPSNPYGHFEDVEVMRIHQLILRDNGVTWRIPAPRPFHIAPAHWTAMRRLIERRRRDHRLWGFKDPRVCLFLGAWRHLLPEAKVLIVFRDYPDSVYSVERRQARDMFQGRGAPDKHLPVFRLRDHGLRLWTSHNEALLSFARTYPDDALVVPLSYIHEGYPLIQALNFRWGLGLRPVATTEVFDPTVTRREPRPLPVSSAAVGERADRLLAALYAEAVRMERGAA